MPLFINIRRCTRSGVEEAMRRPPADSLDGTVLKPLAVTVKNACEIIGVGHTTMWSLIKDEKVQTFSIGRRRLVVYSSLETLLQTDRRVRP
jgi:hypothetical protein